MVPEDTRSNRTWPIIVVRCKIGTGAGANIMPISNDYVGYQLCLDPCFYSLLYAETKCILQFRTHRLLQPPSQSCLIRSMRKWLNSCSLTFSHRPDEVALVWRLQKPVYSKFWYTLCFRIQELIKHDNFCFRRLSSAIFDYTGQALEMFDSVSDHPNSIKRCHHQTVWG